MERYDHKKIEQKWQKYWEEKSAFIANDQLNAKCFYVLDMFPYPSAQGLHVGHPEGYTATDIYSRYLRLKGLNVLHPMGWDAFGLPAENYAIKTGVHPKTLTWQNIDNFRRQIKSLGFSYDWSREINTADPSYYKWTQWLFLKFYEKGLAYRKEAPVNWCPSCQTVLANEQVVGGECERCHSKVEQRKMQQWFFKITSYAERLLQELDGLDWPQPILEMQKNWIGKSEGAEVDFSIVDSEMKIKIFTTRLDTIFGATYLVLAPEYELVKQLKNQITNWSEVEKYVAASRQKTELERKAETKEKTGVELKGVRAINPANNDKIPIFIADYVLTSYGTGAIMAVPAHDERDRDFVRAYPELKIKCVVIPDKLVYLNEKKEVVTLIGPRDKNAIIQKMEEVNGGICFDGQGKIVQSGEFDDMESREAQQAIADKIGAEFQVQYRLRDWLISRQRYWGAPIPIIYCEKCGEQPVPEKDLPVELPMDVDFRPTGESPLARSKAFHSVKCPKCGNSARRESDTMDTFVDSSWYFLRYCDPQNSKEAFDQKKVTTWCPVNLYVGGAEHAVMHLLYARFFTKVLADLNYINFSEPFLKLRNQGLILGEDGQKMSKSRGNVVNPDEIVEQHGADTLRLYEMFMGPLEDSKPWNTASIVGVRRFLERVWNLVGEIVDGDKNLTKVLPAAEQEIKRLEAQMIARVEADIEKFRFNTAISALMEFANILSASRSVSKETRSHAVKLLLTLLYSFAPHAASELWSQLDSKNNVWEQTWPTFDKSLLNKAVVVVAVQVNGKLRATLECAAGSTESDITTIAQKHSIVNKYLSGKNIRRVIYVPGKLINFVID